MAIISERAKINISGIRENIADIEKQLTYLVNCIETEEMYDDMLYLNRQLIEHTLACNSKVSDLLLRMARVKDLIANNEL